MIRIVLTVAIFLICSACDRTSPPGAASPVAEPSVEQPPEEKSVLDEKFDSDCPPGVKAGEMFMSDCNQCVCGGTTGPSRCTEEACAPVVDAGLPPADVAD